MLRVIASISRSDSASGSVFCEPPADVFTGFSTFPFAKRRKHGKLVFWHESLSPRIIFGKGHVIIKGNELTGNVLTVL